MTKIKEEWLNSKTGKYKCPYCNKEYSKKGMGTHIWRNHGEGKNFTANSDGYKNGRIAWNKGLTKETDKRLFKKSETYKNRVKEGKIIPPQTGKPLSEEHKKLISKSRKDFLDKNPDKVPYKLNHYSKGMSYPEKYFKDIFEKENIKYEQEVRISLYSLDFVLFNKKINIEIDGEQHYTDKRIIESDKKRTNFLEKNGWKVIRIRWSNWQKMSKKEKINFINDLKEIGLKH